MYIATARSLVAGEGYVYLGIPFVIRPPGFACLIAPVVAWKGTDFHALNLLVSACGALGVLAFHFLLRARLGLVLATLVPLVLWFNPGFQRLCNQVMSDVPGFAALAACAWLAARHGARPTVRGAVGLGALIGVATHLRSGNLLLVPALPAAWLAGALVARRRPDWGAELGALLRRAGALVAGALLVLGPWALRDQAVSAPPPADQTLLHSYSTGMWHADMGDPRSPLLSASAVLARFPLRARQIAHTLGTRLVESEARPWTPVVGAVLVAALAVAFLRRRRAEDAFALGTLLVVAFYFGYAGRLMLPVFALAAAALVELVRDGTTRVAGERAGTALAALVCVAWIALDWAPRRDWNAIEAQHREYLETARAVRAVLPEGARLGAYRGWHHAVYLERPVWSFEQACERAGTPAASEEIIDKYALDTVLLTPIGLPGPVRQAERVFASFIARRYGSADVGVVRVR